MAISVEELVDWVREQGFDPDDVVVDGVQLGSDGESVYARFTHIVRGVDGRPLIDGNDLVKVTETVPLKRLPGQEPGTN